MRSVKLRLLSLLSAALLTLSLSACAASPSGSSAPSEPSSSGSVSSEASSEVSSEPSSEAESSEPESSAADTEKLYYFYDEACASCDPAGEFYDLALDRLQGVTLPEDYNIFCYNTFTDRSGFFESVCDAFGVPEEDRTTPLFLSAEGYASGETAITQQLRHLICTHYGLADGKTLWYYYRPACPDCNRIEEFFTDTFAANPEFSVIWVDTTDAEPKAAFKEKLAEWNVPDDEWQIPFLVDENGLYLSGDKQIEAELESFLAERAS